MIYKKATRRCMPANAASRQSTTRAARIPQYLPAEGVMGVNTWRGDTTTLRRTCFSVWQAEGLEHLPAGLVDAAPAGDLRFRALEVQARHLVDHCQGRLRAHRRDL